MVALFLAERFTHFSQSYFLAPKLCVVSFPDAVQHVITSLKFHRSNKTQDYDFKTGPFNQDSTARVFCFYGYLHTQVWIIFC